MKNIITSSVIILLMLLIIAAYSGKSTANKSSEINIGYTPNPLLAPLYASSAKEKSWQLTKFSTGGDIGYSLISGSIDAGFIETEKALKLLSG